jgi:hypothetical protein
MAVVIKDFEVVTPPGDAQGQQSATEAPAGGVDRAALADEVEKQLRTRHERKERLHAT